MRTIYAYILTGSSVAKVAVMEAMKMEKPRAQGFRETGEHEALRASKAATVKGDSLAVDEVIVEFE